MKDFSTVERFKAVDTRTNDLQNSVWTVPVSPEFTSVRFGDVLEDFAKYQFFFVEHSWTNFRVVVACN